MTQNCYTNLETKQAMAALNIAPHLLDELLRNNDSNQVVETMDEKLQWQGFLALRVYDQEGDREGSNDTFV